MNIRIKMADADDCNYMARRLGIHFRKEQITVCPGEYVEIQGAFSDQVLKAVTEVVDASEECLATFISLTISE